MAAEGHVYNMFQCRAWIAYQLGANEVLTVVVEVVLIVRSTSVLASETGLVLEG